MRVSMRRLSVIAAHQTEVDVELVSLLTPSLSLHRICHPFRSLHVLGLTPSNRPLWLLHYVPSIMVGEQDEKACCALSVTHLVLAGGMVAAIAGVDGATEGDELLI